VMHRVSLKQYLTLNHPMFTSRKPILNLHLFESVVKDLKSMPHQRVAAQKQEGRCRSESFY
jgi:hypothetical protein